MVLSTAGGATRRGEGLRPVPSTPGRPPLAQYAQAPKKGGQPAKPPRKPLAETLSVRTPSGKGLVLPAAAAGRGGLVVLKRVKGALRPQGVGHNDTTTRERILNVVTSLPFIAIGAFHYRQRQTASGKRCAASLLAVGAVATAYHASSGPLRGGLRKLDYWTIAGSTTTMVHALRAVPGGRSKAAVGAAIALTPFKPFLVSTGNSALLELEFARRARTHKALRPAFAVQAAAGLAAIGCFATEKVAIRSGVHLLHSVWHVLASVWLGAGSHAILSQQEASEALRELV